MNLFVLDKDPEQAAKWHVDRHVGKMILETAQILCAAFHVQGMEGVPYKLTHKNHPCAIWVRQSKANFSWAAELAIRLGIEFHERFGKHHKSIKVILWCVHHYDKLTFPERGMTPFAQAMPEEYQGPDAVEAYRKYYKFGKSHLHQWKRNRPAWID